MVTFRLLVDRPAPAPARSSFVLPRSCRRQSKVEVRRVSGIDKESRITGETVGVRRSL